MTHSRSTDSHRRVPHVLVTNDDGIESPGLAAAVQAVFGIARITVAAPTTQKTATGRSLVGNRADTLHPISLSGFNGSVTAYHIDASPALTVRHTLLTLLAEDRPDLVISGVNFGENLGNMITNSGTVGAALQAASHGIPSIAASRQSTIEQHFEFADLDWSAAVRITRRYARLLLELGFRGTQLPFDILKIDIPDPCPVGTEKRITTVSRQSYYKSVIRNAHAQSRIGDARTIIDFDAGQLDPRDDIYAFAVDRVVAVTPLCLSCSADVGEAADLLNAESADGAPMVVGSLAATAASAAAEPEETRP